MSDIVQCRRNEGKKKQSASYSEKDEEMQCIESITTSDIIGCIRDNQSWDDEEYLKQGHILGILEWKICRSCHTRSAHVSWFCRCTRLCLLILIEWNCWIDWSTLNLHIFWNSCCRRLVFWSLRSEGTCSKKCRDNDKKKKWSHRGKIKK